MQQAANVLQSLTCILSVCQVTAILWVCYRKLSILHCTALTDTGSLNKGSMSIIQADLCLIYDPTLQNQSGLMWSGVLDWPYKWTVMCAYCCKSLVVQHDRSVWMSVHHWWHATVKGKAQYKQGFEGFNTLRVEKPGIILAFLVNYF